MEQSAQGGWEISMLGGFQALAVWSSEQLGSTWSWPHCEQEVEPEAFWGPFQTYYSNPAYLLINPLCWATPASGFDSCPSLEILCVWQWETSSMPQPRGMCEYQVIKKENSMKSVPRLFGLSLHQNAAPGPDSNPLAVSQEVKTFGLVSCFLVLWSVSGDRLQSWQCFSTVRRNGWVGLVGCVTWNSGVPTFVIQIKWGVFRGKAAFLRHPGDLGALVLVLLSTSAPSKQRWLLELPAVAVTPPLRAVLALYHEFASVFHTSAPKRRECVPWRKI